MGNPPPSVPPEREAWEIELRGRFRSFQRSAAGVLLLLAACAAVFIVALQSLLQAGPRPIHFWGPFGFYVSLGLAFASRRRWLHAAICLLWLVLAAWQLDAAAHAVDTNDWRGGRFLRAQRAVRAV